MNWPVHMGKSPSSVYLYPITPYCYNKGSNDYIFRVKEALREQFKVVNRETTLGLLDIIFKLHLCDIIYFNWIEDLPDKKWGYFQTCLLPFVLLTCKIFRIRVAWFVHNNVSHYKKNTFAKRFIRNIMLLFADEVFSHSNEVSVKKKSLPVFEHPVEENEFVEMKNPPAYDLLIWGSVSAYKGVIEFLQYNYENPGLRNYKVLIAGRFASDELYEQASRLLCDNVTIENRVFEEEELKELFRQSRYVLFCYNSRSVLSSAALCKSLSFGKTVIGPYLGSFKELGARGLIYNYTSLDNLCRLMDHLRLMDQYIDHDHIRQYIHITSWPKFRDFLSGRLQRGAKNTAG